MSKKNPENPFVTLELCNERVKRLEGKIDDLREVAKTIDKRNWWILGSVVVLGVIAILIAILK